MKTSQHPARFPPGYTPPVEDEPQRGRIDLPDTDEAPTGALRGEPEDWAPTSEPADISLPPQGSWQLIDSAPHDGHDLMVRWGEDDDAGRIVRWRAGRYFTGRRWMTGGRWSPSDDLAHPLPMEPPTEWYRPPEAVPDADPDAEVEAA